MHSGGDGQLTLSGVTVTGNDAARRRRRHQQRRPGANLTVTGATISGNTALDSGGGLAAESERATVVTDVEISGNSGRSASPSPTLPGVPTDCAGGGGAYTDGGGTVTITRVRLPGQHRHRRRRRPGHARPRRRDRHRHLVRGNTVTCEECSGGGIEQGGANATFER